MDVLKYFILGFLFIYLVQILDIVLQIISAYSSVAITRYQVKINELSGEEKIDDGNRIGFHYEPANNDLYEIDGDYID